MEYKETIMSCKEAASVATPWIGLTPGLNHEETYVSVRDDFCQALLRLGARPVLLPLDAGEAVLQDYVQTLDGFLFTGGGDVDPQYFHQPCRPWSGDISPRRDAMELSPLSRARMYSLRLSWNELVQLYYKYIGVLGSPAAEYRFEAVWHGRAVRTVVREPVQSVRLECTVHNPLLTDGPTWDCAAVSLRAIDQNGNLLPYCGEAVCLSVEGPLKILGPSVVPLRGGMAGTYLATTGEAGRAVLHCRMEGALDTEAVLTVRSREEQNV